MKASCCSSVRSWPRKTSTAYASIPASIAATSSGPIGLVMSIPETSPANAGCDARSARIEMGIWWHSLPPGHREPRGARPGTPAGGIYPFRPGGSSGRVTLAAFGWVYRQLDIDTLAGASDHASATLGSGDDEAMATRIVLTYADLVAMPADGKRYELHEGEIYMTAAPRPRHQQVVGNLHLILAAHVRRLGLGEVFLSPIDVILADVTVVEPDLVYLDAARLGRVSDRGIEGPPTLAIEVLSPSTCHGRPRGEAPALGQVRRAALLDRRSGRPAHRDLSSGRSLV